MNKTAFEKILDFKRSLSETQSEESTKGMTIKPFLNQAENKSQTENDDLLARAKALLVLRKEEENKNSPVQQKKKRRRRSTAAPRVKKVCKLKDLSPIF
jgi:hypothetical protein